LPLPVPVPAPVPVPCPCPLSLSLPMRRFRPSLFPKHRFGRALLEDATTYAKVIEAYQPPVHSPIYSISQTIKHRLDSQSGLLTPLTPSMALQKAAAYVEELDKKYCPTIATTSIPSSSSTSKPSTTTTKTDSNPVATNPSAEPTPLLPVDSEAMRLHLRLHLARLYFQSLSSHMKDAELSTMIAKNIHINRLIDTMLLGTASERIAGRISLLEYIRTRLYLTPVTLEHLLLFGPEVSEELLQLSMHIYFESEVATALYLIQQYPNVHKKCRKRAEKVAKTYLLDALELNVKSRCVYAWSGKLCTAL
jgi:hypothetical protein